MSYLALSALLATASGLSAAAHPQPRPALPLEAIPGLLNAFRSYRVVSFPGGHTDNNESQALLRALVRDPRFASTVNDIVVEFGSSRYQDLMDRLKRQCQVK